MIDFFKKIKIHLYFFISFFSSATLPGVFTLEKTIESVCIDFRYMLLQQKKDIRVCNSYRNVVLEMADVCEIKFVSQLDLERATDYDMFLLRYLDYIRTELKNKHNTIKRKMSALNKFFSYLVRYNYIRMNPIPSFREWHLSMYKEPDAEMRYLPTVKEVKDVLRSVKTIRLLFMHLLFAKTGVRPMEVRMADRNDFYWDRKYWKIKEHAKRSGKIVPLDDELILVGQMYFKTRTDDNPALFLGPWGRRINKDTMREEMEETFRDLGLYKEGGALNERMTPYSYRHFQNTEFTLKQLPAGILKEIRGDKRENDDTSQRYIHYNERVLVKEYNHYSFPLLRQSMRIPKK